MTKFKAKHSNNKFHRRARLVWTNLIATWAQYYSWHEWIRTPLGLIRMCTPQVDADGWAWKYYDELSGVVVMPIGQKLVCGNKRRKSKWRKHAA